MTTSQVTVRALAAVALVAGFAAAGRAQPAAVTVKWALEQSPKQAGVSVNTPTPDQAARCKVTPLPNPKVPGYLVTDGDGKPIRQFVSYDNKSFNIISYYTDGAESYREVYPPAANEPYSFRWLGANGTKWGLDRNRDGAIDEWAIISPEEVSQELLKAVIKGDENKLKALLATPDQLKAIGLPSAELERMNARLGGAAKKLKDAADQLKLSDKAKWLHTEFAAPGTRPADSFEGREDYTAYKGGTVVIEDGGKTVFLQTGELVQIGRAWKVIDGPSAGAAPAQATDGGQIVEEGIRALVDKLNDLDKKAPNPPTVEALGAFNAKRAELLEEIAAKAVNKEAWIKMLLDALADAGGAGKPGNPQLSRLREWRDVAAAPATSNPPIAAYAAFRLVMAENSAAMIDVPNDKLGAVQEKLRAGLEDYLKAYGQSADAPEAALRLAMAYELSGGKDMAEVKANEGKAKQWYEHLAKNFATHAHAAKANGAIKRLDCEGKPLELSGPQLGSGQTFDAAQKDKVVIVYYWASWSGSLADDAKKLDALVKTYGPKGLALVTVGLDHDAKTAADAVAKSGLPGTHLYKEGGLDASPLAAAYGIMAPPHVLIAGKDGKITNRGGHVAALEDEVKKLLGEK